MPTHIQLHRSGVTGATPDVSTMLEGEPAVNFPDKKLYVKGSDGSLITLIDAHTGHDAAGTVGGIQFKDASGFSADRGKFMFDSANTRVGIGTQSPREELEVVGTIQGTGVSADGATFGIGGITVEGHINLGGDLVIAEDQTIKIGGDSEHIAFNGDGAEINVRANELSIDRYLQHFGDSNTHLEFQTDQITLAAGGADMIDITTEGATFARSAYFPVGISAEGGTFGTRGITVDGHIKVAGGITLGGDLHFSSGNADIRSDGDVVMEITTRNVRLGDVSGSGNSNTILVRDSHNAIQLTSGQIELVSDDVRIGQDLAHRLDTNTKLSFPSNDQIQLQVAGSTIVDITPEGATFDRIAYFPVGISAEGATFGTKGITVDGHIKAVGITLSGDLQVGGNLLLDADIVHVGDSDTGIIFTPNNIDLFTGPEGQDPGIRLHTGLKVSLGDIEAAADGATLVVNDGANNIKLNSDDIQIPSAIVHSGDTNTKIQFSAADTIKLTAGGTDYQTITSAGTNFADTDVVRPNLKDYSETVNAIGSVNSNTAVDFSAGNVQTVTIGGNCEFSFTNPPASGKAGTLTLIVTNGGGHTVTFASAVKWPSDVAPSLTGSNGIDILSFITTDGGTNIYGFVGGLNFS